MASLDLLILSLIDAGIDTPYRWQTQAGLSLGATLPAARRLLAGRLVSERKPGPRGRREFRITRTGRSELKNIDQHLDAVLLEQVGDMESMLRLVAIALHAGRQDVAAHLLQEAGSEYDRRAARAQKRASDLSERDGLAALRSGNHRPTATPTGSWHRPPAWAISSLPISEPVKEPPFRSNLKARPLDQRVLPLVRLCPGHSSIHCGRRFANACSMSFGEYGRDGFRIS